MKRSKRVLGAFMAAAVLFSNLMTIPISAEASGSQTDEMAEESKLQGAGEVLYEADFSNLDGFDTYLGNSPGQFSVEEDALKIISGTGNKAVAKDQEFTNFIYETDITIEKQADLPDKSSAQGGIIFRVSQAQGNVSDGYFGYYFGVDAKNQQVTLGRSSGNNWHEIASKKMSIKYGETYHLMVAAYGSHITCYVDYNGTNYAKLDVDDSTHASGSVGMRNWISHAVYRNATVRAYEEVLLDDEKSYTNPLLNNCADPDILYHNGTYYLYPTNAGDGNDDQGIKVYTSTDLVHWTDKGFAFKKGDGWGDKNFWAPDTIERDGIFYMYYVANEQICVATSDSPLGPYKQDKKEPMHYNVKEIDAHVFYDEASQKYYIYFVRFTGGNVIWGAELNDDMKTIKEDTVTEIVRADQGWDQDMGLINEGPFMLTKDGKYYMTYSGSHFMSPNYGSGYAVSDSPLGPFKKYEYNPIMKSNSLAHGTGHHCITTSPDGKELFMVYHSHYDLSTADPRKLCIDRMQFTTDRDGNQIMEVKGPTVTPQALPSGAVDANNFIEFDRADLQMITVENKTPVSEWNLPSQIGIFTSKGDGDTAYTAQVKWDTKGYEPNEEGEQLLTIKGEAVLPEGIANLGNIRLEPEIQVKVLSSDPDSAFISEALKKVEIKNAQDIRENITLPQEVDGVKLQWKSGNESVISAKAKKNQDYYDAPAGIVSRQDQDQQVTLTVTGSYKNKTADRDIKVTVKAKPKKKEYAGYLYAHFKEFPGSKSQQQIYYGISKDGMDWTALNDNNAVLESTVGDKATRDPYIIRSPQGDKFYLIATDQTLYKYGDNIRWDLLSTQGSQALTIWESTDLVHWTDERNIDVASSIQAGCAWAPEAIYDEGTGEYLVYWSSKVESDGFARQYNWVSKTRDFYTFTEPELFNDLPISNIDTSMHREGDTYYKLLKLEDGGNTRVILQSAKDHPLAYGNAVNQVKIGDRTYNNVGGTYQQINNSADGCLESFKGSYEGATMFKFNDREEWCVMVDEYGGKTRGYIPFITNDLDAQNSVKALADDEYLMQDGGKHGVILPITQEEYDALVSEYGIADGPLASMEEKINEVISYDFENVKADSRKVENTVDAKQFAMELFGNAKVRYDEEKKSNVLYLDGSDETYAQLPQGAFDGLDHMTISMDVKPETTEENHVDFMLGQDNNKYLFLKFGDANIRTGVTVRSWPQENKLEANKGGYLNKWINATIVVDNHDMHFYLDNKKIGSRKVRNISELGEALICYLGKSFYTDPYFKGCYDNIKVYNRALDEEEIGVSYEMVQKLEAESGTLTGLAKVVDRHDASGGKKVGTIDNTASSVTFKLYAPKAGTYRVEIAAAGNPSEFPNSSHRYWVNGDEEHAKVVKYNTRGWDNWDLYPVTVDLKKGENKFTIAHSGIDKSFSELDYITLYLVYPEVEISVDGKSLNGFDMNKSLYDLDVESLSKLPKVEAKVTGAEEVKLDVKVTQGTEKRPEAYVKITSEQYPELNKSYTIRFYGDKTFQNPLVNYGADPFVTYEDGYYYYVRVNGDKGIYVSKSPELSRIGQVEPKLVYTPSGNEPSAELWAPEIHFINGKWYIYYTAGAGATHRMHVLESKSADAQGEYTFAGKLAPTTDKWAIDQTVLEHEGQLYAIWSGWEGNANVDQRIYIAKMDSPTSITGERVELSKPEYTWEKLGGTPTINEGAQIAKSPDGTVNIVYSASGSWSDDYCLGVLTLKDKADPMKKDSWKKADEPIFKKNGSTTFSTGHACFVPSPDGTEDYVVYHATRGSGEGWNGRGVRAQRLYWNEDGTPYIGEASEYNGKVNCPSGTKSVDYMRYEAEKAQLSGNVKVRETYNSSDGKKAAGFTAAGDQAGFKVNVEKRGRYKLYIGAAAGTDKAGFYVKVNNEKAVDKAVVNFNAAPANNLITDNWAGYEMEVVLNKGDNSIVIGKSANLNGAELDYIELLLLKELEEPGEPDDPKDPVTDVFADIEKDHWFVDYVQYVYDHKYMTGLDETHFGPNGVLSRAQFATILYRMEGSPKVTYKPTFPDVADGEFYSEAVIWASAKNVGVIGGYADGTFGPGDDLTREQMAVMLYRYAEYKGYDMSAKGSLKDFPDGKLVSPFAEKAMQWAVGAGVISGNADKTLAPQGTTSRAVCATMIMRVQELLGGNKE